jgi:hypothetical protein
VKRSQGHISGWQGERTGFRSGSVGPGKTLAREPENHTLDGNDFRPLVLAHNVLGMAMRIHESGPEALGA